MSSLDYSLITNNEEKLRVVCADVLPEEIGVIRSALESELERLNRLGRSGIGLAAPQIGIAKKMSIVRLDGCHLDLVNCEIKTGYDEKIFQNEGCLSFPGRVETTRRYQQIYVVGNAVGSPDFIANGMLAVVCQHELDHTSQKLFFDRSVPKVVKVPPNDPCVCGSGKKFKKCCARK